MKAAMLLEILMTIVASIEQTTRKGICDGKSVKWKPQINMGIIEKIMIYPHSDSIVLSLKVILMKIHLFKKRKGKKKKRKMSPTFAPLTLQVPCVCACKQQNSSSREPSISPSHERSISA